MYVSEQSCIVFLFAACHGKTYTLPILISTLNKYFGPFQLHRMKVQTISMRMFLSKTHAFVVRFLFSSKNQWMNNDLFHGGKKFLYGTYCERIGILMRDYSGHVRYIAHIRQFVVDYDFPQFTFFESTHLYW